MAGFQPAKACKICIRVKADKKLFKRIYGAKFYVKGGESLSTIATEENLQYPALLRHCKRHQHLSDEKLAESQLNEIAKAENKKALGKVLRTSDVRAGIMEKLQDELETRDMSELTARDVIALLTKVSKDTDDVAAKRKDQDIDIYRMMGRVRSGEIVDYEEDELFDPNEIEEGQVVGPSA